MFDLGMLDMSEPVKETNVILIEMGKHLAHPVSVSHDYSWWSRPLAILVIVAMMAVFAWWVSEPRK